MMSKNILLSLQKKYQEGGYALVSPRDGKVFVFGSNLKDLYKKIDQKKVNDQDKMVMYIPSPQVKHVFSIPLNAGTSL